MRVIAKTVGLLEVLDVSGNDIPPERPAVIELNHAYRLLIEKGQVEVLVEDVPLSYTNTHLIRDLIAGKTPAQIKSSLQPKPAPTKKG